MWLLPGESREATGKEAFLFETENFALIPKFDVMSRPRAPAMPVANITEQHFKSDQQGYQQCETKATKERDAIHIFLD